MSGRVGNGTYIELPPLNMLARVLIGDDDDKLLHLAGKHPLVQL